METLKIVGWASYDSNYPSINLSNINSTIVKELAIKEIKDKNLIISSKLHQSHKLGCPVFNNGTIFRCSMKLWASLMSLAHSNNNEEDAIKHINYYLDTEKSNLPTEKATVEINNDEINNGTIPAISEQDIALIKEKIKQGITTFYTNDKALKTVFKDYLKSDESMKLCMENEKKYNFIFENNKDTLQQEDEIVLRKYASLNYNNKKYFIYIDNENKIILPIKQNEDGSLEKQIDEHDELEIIQIFYSIISFYRNLI